MNSPLKGGQMTKIGYVRNQYFGQFPTTYKRKTENEK